MTQSSGFDFTKFVPGFDFLKNLTPGAGVGSAPAPGWVAPTLDPEELEKRIQELKTVHFWLEQNTKAVAATIQALEVQRMTLSTLKGMNLSFHELAESLKVNAQASVTPSATPSTTPFASASAPETPAAPQEESPAPQAAQSKSKTRKTKDTVAAVDPAQWWGALTDQFQHIAHKAMKDMAHSANAHAGTSAASAKAAAAKPKNATKNATKTATKPTAKKAARKSARPAARKTSSKTSR